MSDRRSVIEPQQAPLSHLESGPSESRNWLRIAGLAVAVLAGVGLLVWVFTLQAPVPDVQPPEIERAASVPARSSGAEDQPLAPFEAAELARAREKAQATLAEFVETQIQLEEQMKVDDWAPEAYRDAKQLAKAGDEAFLAEDYGLAESSYAAARDAIIAIEQDGERRFADFVAQGQAALNARDVAVAEQSFASALIIKPDDATAQAGAERAGTLPDVINALREARNHELSERWAEALASYDEAAAIDPLTAGLDELRAGTARLQNDAAVRELLTEGFAALDRKRYGAARRAFDAALKRSPGNEVAAGGLQQVAAQSELGAISRDQRAAEAAEASEDWDKALALYEQVLARDANIQFAKEGRSRVRQIVSSRNTLMKIRSNPDKLSSAKLFAEAQEIVAEARELENPGSEFVGLLNDVETLVRSYSSPVDVTIVSDAETEILLSSIGRLGRFARKTVALRPGEYTVIGSQDGCRDVRQNFIVRPNMQPVTVRCNEFLGE